MRDEPEALLQDTLKKRSIYYTGTRGFNEGADTRKEKAMYSKIKSMLPVRSRDCQPGKRAILWGVAAQWVISQ